MASEQDFHPLVTIAMPNGPLAVASWNGKGYECIVCHVEHGTVEVAGMHAHTHIARSPARWEDGT